jgi:hypothetical protein
MFKAISVVKNHIFWAESKVGFSLDVLNLCCSYRTLAGYVHGPQVRQAISLIGMRATAKARSNVANNISEFLH